MEEKRIEDQQLMLVIVVIASGQAVADTVLMKHIGEVLPVIRNQPVDDFGMAAHRELVVAAILRNVDPVSPLLVCGAESAVVHVFL